MDVFSKEFRSTIMSRIKSENTKPELLLRSALHKDGLRFWLHYKLPGRPDIVFTRKKLAIFVNGCFWHGHKCKMDHVPKDNSEFWQKKIENNIKRDFKVYNILENDGWTIYISWECLIINNLLDEVKNIENLLF